MIGDELKERTENESDAGIRTSYSIKWARVATVFGHSLLVATLAYPLDDANKLTRHPAHVLSKVFAECVEDKIGRASCRERV